MSPDPNVFTLGHSPDPDDAFMFYAIAENKIDLRGYRFEHRLEDIQTLNERALRGELHISAISIHAYAYVADKYALLPCGASMGDGYGPIVVRKCPTSNSESFREQGIRHPTPNKDVADVREWLRGLCDRCSWNDDQRVPRVADFISETSNMSSCPFDQIFDAVKDGRADAGLIIHEGQLTYARSGFQKIVDLGEWWKRETGLPLPLGGNVIRKDIPQPVRHDLLEIMRESIDFGLAHRDEAVRHSMPYARDMNAELAGKFIGMYVNDFTRDYGKTGRAAIRKFLGDAHDAGYIDNPVKVEFVD